MLKLILTSMCYHVMIVTDALHTAKCNLPSRVDNTTRLSSYTDPAVEGSQATFSCPSGLVLTGPNSSTCTDSGQWEPDPLISTCRGMFVVCIA